MALLSRIFQNRRNTRCSPSRSSSTEGCKGWQRKELEKSQVRLVLFRDHHLKGRSLLFDSSAVHKVDTQQNPGRTSKFYVPLSSSASRAPPGGPTSESSESPHSGVNNPGFTFSKPGSDTKMLGEMMYGSVAMSYKGASFKVHSIRSPSQIMLTKLFQLNVQNKETNVEGESFDGDSIQSGAGDCGAPCPIHTTSSPQIAHSVPMDVPSPPNRGIADFETEDSGFDNSLTSSTGSLCTSLPSPSSSASNSFTSSLNSNSMHRRWLRSQTKSLEYNLMKRASDESTASQSPVTASKRPPIIGLGIIFNLPPDPEQAKMLQYFLFSHIMLLESHINKLCNSIDKAISSKKYLVRNVYEAFEGFVESMRDLYLTPRLAQPVWLTMTTGNTTHRVPLCQQFLKELMICLDKYDTKNTKFFVSTLVTAVLTHHLAWVPTVTPAWAAPSRTYLDKHSAKWLDAIARSHPYNPLWAQLSDLYGAIGYPARLSRTVIVGKKHDVVNKMLYILSYFIRCSEVLENTEQQPVVVEPEYLDEEAEEREDAAGEREDAREREDAATSPTDHLQGLDLELEGRRSHNDSQNSCMVASDSSDVMFNSGSTIKSGSGLENWSRPESAGKAGDPLLLPHVVAVTNSQDDLNTQCGCHGVTNDSQVPCRHCYQTSTLTDLSKTIEDCDLASIKSSSESSFMKMQSLQCVECSVTQVQTPATSAMQKLGELKIEETVGDESGVCQLSPNDIIKEHQRERTRNVGRVAEAVASHTDPFADPAKDLTSPRSMIYPDLSKVTSDCYCDEGLYSLAPDLDDSRIRTNKSRGSFSEVPGRSGDDLDSGIFESGCQNCPTSSSVSCDSSNDNLSEEEHFALDLVHDKATGLSTNSDSSRSSPCANAIPHTSSLAQQIKVPFDRSSSMFDEYFDDDTPVSVLTSESKPMSYGRMTSVEDNSIFDEYLNEPCPDVTNIAVGTGDLNDKPSVEHFSVIDQYFKEDSGSFQLPEGSVRQQVEETLSLMHRLQQDQQAHSEAESSTTFARRPNSLNLDVAAARQLSSPYSRQNSAVSSHATPTERRRHLSTVSTASSVETLDFFLFLKEVPLPRSDYAGDERYIIQEFERNFGRSLLAGQSDHYLSDFVLHGTRDPNFQAKLHSDLTMAVQEPVLDEPIAEAACILADTDKWTVKLQSCQYSSLDRVHSKDMMASRYILDTMESVHDLWKLKMSPEFCLMHLEDKLQEIYFKSKVLAEYIRTHRKISLKELSSVLDFDISDLPLMLAVAGTHSSLMSLALLT